MPTDLVRLDDAHALRVVDSPEGPRAEPVVRSDGRWRRAAAGDGAATALLGRLYDGSPVPDGFRISGPAAAPSELDSADEREMGVDQTHQSWVVGGRVVVKWMTEPLVGPHPAPERLRRLAALGHPESPALWGLIEWREPATGHWVPVVLAQTYLAGTEDGWTWAVVEARRALGLEAGDPTDFAEDIGGVVARLHLALADDPPALLTAEVAREHANQAQAALDLAIGLTEQFDPGSGALLVAHRSRIRQVLGRLAGAAGTPVLPIHGDLHVGQLLRDAGGRYAVVDFDGNPTRSAALRAADAPAACDVAGMLVCLENVEHVARHEGTESAAAEAAGGAWTRQVGSQFVTGYRHGLGSRVDLYDEALVPAYAWEQLCREFIYAAQHLPAWLYVPAAALRRRVAPGPG